MQAMMPLRCFLIKLLVSNFDISFYRSHIKATGAFIVYDIYRHSHNRLYYLHSSYIKTSFDDKSKIPATLPSTQLTSQSNFMTMYFTLTTSLEEAIISVLSKPYFPIALINQRNSPSGIRRTIQKENSLMKQPIH